MKLVIPFKKNIKFDTNIHEICSISLEHEITKNEHELLGNFIFEGTYKEHELSINETPFSFIVPFSVDYDTRVDINTIDFSIDNFTYDIVDDSLDVTIDYIVIGDEVKEEIIDVIEDEAPIDIIEERNIEILQENIQEEKEETQVFETTLNTLNLDDEYVKYHVHIVKKEDTLESIAILYNIDINKIQKLNNITTVCENDHLIIPL